MDISEYLQMSAGIGGHWWASEGTGGYRWTMVCIDGGQRVLVRITIVNLYLPFQHASTFHVKQNMNMFWR